MLDCLSCKCEIIAVRGIEMMLVLDQQFSIHFPTRSRLLIIGYSKVLSIEGKLWSYTLVT